MKRQNPSQLDLCFSPAAEPVETEPEGVGIKPWVKERRSIFIRCLAHWDKPKTDKEKSNHSAWLQRRVFELGGLSAAW